MDRTVNHTGRGRHRVRRARSTERTLAPQTAVTLGLLSLVPVLAAAGPLTASALMLYHGAMAEDPPAAQTVAAVTAAGGLMALAVVTVTGILIVTGWRSTRWQPTRINQQSPRIETENQAPPKAAHPTQLD
ncbi:hypothetical protein ABZW96_33565 [Nocardia sp. NPDC004168]|uniref:hypothetical protein n=1 Tax=Nocardia sp. NPDC004168 TaxID=3154452 RepID=UPI0033A6F0AA